MLYYVLGAFETGQLNYKISRTTETNRANAIHQVPRRGDLVEWICHKIIHASRKSLSACQKNLTRPLFCHNLPINNLFSTHC